MNRPIDPPKSPKEINNPSWVVSGLTGITLALTGLFLTSVGLMLHQTGTGDTQSAKAEYVLGVDLDLTELHYCGEDCVFIGPYQVEIDLWNPPAEALVPQYRETIPWYTELRRGSKPNQLMGYIPREEPKRPAEQPKNSIPLPSNLTPRTMRVVDYDYYRTGKILFDNGEVLRVRRPEDMEQIEKTTHWVVETDPKEKDLIIKMIALSPRIESSHGPWEVRYDYDNVPDLPPYYKPEFNPN